MASYISTTKGLAGQRTQNREVMRQARVGAVTQLDVDESAERIIGALHAQTTTGVEFKLVSASGQIQLTARMRGWEVVDPTVPDKGTGAWYDVYGNRFVMPALPGSLRYSVPCAAVKLLIALGQRNTKHLRFNWIHIYEEACAGTLENGKRSSTLRQWHGQGKAFTYAAHSCAHCEVRVPMLLCDRGGD
ncbi:MAG: hypothetical protein K2Y26_17105 [Gemmatimonadaceae bacterium]|nr:hypothetical protein [Gemmatimonadaceae bacterium]